MCKFDKDLLQEYIDGLIQPLERILLEEHIKYCKECRQDLNQLKILDWDLKHREEVEIPLELSSLRRATLEEYFTSVDKEQSRISDDILDKSLTYSTLKNTVHFVQFLPGKSIVNAAVKSKERLVPKKDTKNPKKGPLQRIIGL